MELTNKQIGTIKASLALISIILLLSIAGNFTLISILFGFLLVCWAIRMSAESYAEFTLTTIEIPILFLTVENMLTVLLGLMLSVVFIRYGILMFFIAMILMVLSIAKLWFNKDLYLTSLEILKLSLSKPKHSKPISKNW